MVPRQNVGSQGGCKKWHGKGRRTRMSKRIKLVRQGNSKGTWYYTSSKAVLVSEGH